MTTSRKPRTIVSVTPYVRADGQFRCKVEVDDGAGIVHTVALHDLTRPELQRAASITFPEIPANVWLRFKSDEIQELIRANNHADAIAAVEVKRSTQHKAEVISIADVNRLDQAETADHGSQVKSQDKAAQLAELLADLAGKGSVDIDTVRQVVAEEVQKVADDVRITRVEVILPDGKVDLPELHHVDLPKVLAKVEAGCNVFIVGPAGTGKSVLAEQVAKATHREFHALSFGPTTPTSKLFGYNDANGNFQPTPLHEAYLNGGLFLGDELDNGHPGLLAEQNQFLSNGHCAFANGMASRHANFRYIATGNTYGRGGDRLFVGRNQLDAATLDRFVFHLLGIDENLEERSSMRFSTTESAPKCRAWIEKVRKVRAQAEVAKLPVVISPRASIDGCKLITTGVFTEAEVIDSVLLKGLSDDQRTKLKV